jgi:hypothetical protein
VLGDVDRDGDLDAVLGGTNDAPGPTWLLAGDGRGGLGTPAVIPNAPNAALALADFDGDGRLDLAGGVPTQSAGQSQYVYGHIRVLPGNGDGTFQTPSSYGYGGDNAGRIYYLDLRQSIAADLFRDGRPSLVTVGRIGIAPAYSGGLTVLRNVTGTP